jgi:DNA-binding NtrC family response regulator
VIVMTTEATFERAMQGIGLYAADLWLKPQSPDNIRRVLTQCCRVASRGEQRVVRTAGLQPEVSYEALFLRQASSADNCRLMLLQPENPQDIPGLHAF